MIDPVLQQVRDLLILNQELRQKLDIAERRIEAMESVQTREAPTARWDNLTGYYPPKFDVGKLKQIHMCYSLTKELLEAQHGRQEEVVLLAKYKLMVAVFEESKKYFDMETKVLGPPVNCTVITAKLIVAKTPTQEY